MDELVVGCEAFRQFVQRCDAIGGRRRLRDGKREGRHRGRVCFRSVPPFFVDGIGVGVVGGKGRRAVDCGKAGPTLLHKKASGKPREQSGVSERRKGLYEEAVTELLYGFPGISLSGFPGSTTRLGMVAGDGSVIVTRARITDTGCGRAVGSSRLVSSELGMIVTQVHGLNLRELMERLRGRRRCRACRRTRRVGHSRRSLSVG